MKPYLDESSLECQSHHGQSEEENRYYYCSVMKNFVYPPFCAVDVAGAAENAAHARALLLQKYHDNQNYRQYQLYYIIH